MLKPMKIFFRKHNSGAIRNSNVISDNRGVSTTDVIITIVAVIVIIVSVVFLVMNIVNLQKVNDEIAEIKATIESKQEALNKLVELGQSEEVLKDNYERNKLYIPDERDEIGITSDVTSVILNADATFGKIDFNDESNIADGIKDVPLTVRVTCSYEVLTDIIDELGTMERLYTVESIVVIDNGMDTGELTSDILIHAYYNNN